ncbi:MAG: phosphate ABC transporter permease PstA [bacterium]|nr:phosphate ABC transporter permease PstA [bacterium]
MAASDFLQSRKVASGLPGVWATGLATALVLAFLAGLVWIVTVNALAWFWPAQVMELNLVDGDRVVGQLVGRESIPVGSRVEGGSTHRIKVKVGNRELTGQDFRWLDEQEVASQSVPLDLVRVVRTEYGDAFGRIVAATDVSGASVAAGDFESLAAVFSRGEELRKESARLQKKLQRTRGPLTHLEEQLDLVERSNRSDTPEAREEIERLQAEIDATVEEIGPRLDRLREEMNGIVGELDSARIEIEAGEDTLSVSLAQVIEVVWANRMGVGARCFFAVKEAFAFLFTEPREANTEGGIFPALFGTVLMVLMMSVAVVPLGVITAVYMTEYASDGIALRLANQAVNNLAGVPSIVFGMFGLAFFLYGVGGGIDHTLFSDRLPTPTFGTGGILWASLTLALLTVPVVVVATREGLLAVPRSWRDGSVALGATQWQTLQKIVLPAAMPGMLTGLILAVSRAAGEVAPLMLTGAVKLAPTLPVDGTFPFLHLQRKFMHLGFHIYDVSMQSPNVEAAKPMAFATTLVLLLLVALMNLVAVVVRRRLRKAYRSQAV